MPRRFPSTSHWARNIASAPVTVAPVTLSCWYKPIALGSTAVLMQLGDYTSGTTDNKFRMLKASTNQLQFIASTTSSTTLTNTLVTMVANQWYHCLGSANTTNSPNRAVIDGFVATSVSANRIPVGVNSLVIGAQLASTSTFVSTASGDIMWPAVWNVQLTADEERALADGVSPRLIRPSALMMFIEEDDQRKLWRDYISGYTLDFPTTADTAQFVPDVPPNVVARRPRRAARIISFSTVAAGATGTLAVTEANDTLSASGAVTITGSISVTESADTLSSSGVVTVSGSLSVTEAADTLSASGVVSSGIDGTVSVTEANDTSAASGTVTSTGSINVTEAADTCAASGTVGVGGTISVTEANDTCAASGTVATIITGTVNVNESNDTCVAAGTVSGDVVISSALDGEVISFARFTASLLSKARMSATIDSYPRLSHAGIYSEAA